MRVSDVIQGRVRPTAAGVAAGTIGAAMLAAVFMATAAASFDPDAQPTGWVSRPALSSSDLRSGQEIVYRAEYKAGTWTGTVRANPISATGSVQSASAWTGIDTASILATTDWNNGRRIVTRHADGSNIPFRWTSLAPTQQSLLGTATTGPALLNYVRGDRTNENPSSSIKFRARESVQGDIQHSTLLYWNHGGGVKRLYVGGNDGMLHAFDATTGSEVFAYVPSMLLSRLPRLGAMPYVHSLYVDGGLTAAEVLLGGSVRTLLAGALGGGGRGLFMLDVTNPSPATEAAAASVIKWEITPATSGYANLGYTYAAPKLARLENGVAAVIVGNGYVNAGNGRASLFVINADTGARICEVDTGVGSTTSPNGLSSATLLDGNADGKVDYAYAGDIDGNLWRFDLRGTTSPACTATRLHTTSPQQAITAAPVLFNHPAGGRLVLFGTGRTLTPADTSDASVHYVYGWWDGAPAANTTWLDQTLTEVTSGTQRLRALTANVPNWASGGHRGWRLSLPTGERLVGENQFVNDDRYYFGTTNPTVRSQYVGDADGANWLMQVQALTGGSPSGPIFDVNGDGKVDASDNVGGAVVVGKYLGAGVSSQPVLTDQANVSQVLYNRQSDIDYAPPPATGELGVSGGHFDPDFYFNPGTRLDQLVHHHEYDDTYDVTGVNFLNASDAGLNLGSKLGAGVAFKILVMNQYLNPAAQLSVGGVPYMYARYYGGQTEAPNASQMLADQPAYNLSTVKTLVFNLPLDAFKSKDWWRDGGTPRAGLIPTTTGCVNKVNSDGSTPTLGPNGERHNGAFTVQIIKAETPVSAIEMNYAGGGAKYGWRVKAGQVNTYVLAEYTVFWHHGNGKCYGQAGWVPNPPEDFSTGGKVTTSGGDDPKGQFGVVPATVTVTSTSTTISGDTTTLVVTYSDGKKQTTVTTLNGDGTETVTITARDGTSTVVRRMSNSSLGQAPVEILQRSRRINWREVIRQ